MAGEDEKSYSGRWVARVQGKIIAQGGTPEQARRAALSRYKETADISFMPFVPGLSFPPILDTVYHSLPQGLTMFLVGGAVRDAILGRPIQDLDFVLANGAIATARKVANSLVQNDGDDLLKADFFPLDPLRGTGRVLVTQKDGTRLRMDFSTFRGSDLEADLLGRDFTVNAIAFDPCEHTIHDPLNGVIDLQAKRLRACSEASFRDDPVRILRGVRLAANLDFHILPETRQAMKESADLLMEVSAERIRDEFFHLLVGRKPAAGLRALNLLNVLDKVLPEIFTMKGFEQPAPHVHDLWEHTLAVVNHLENVTNLLSSSAKEKTASDPVDGIMVQRLGCFRESISRVLTSFPTADRPVLGLLFLAAIFHDAAKPSISQVDDSGQMHFWNHEQAGAKMAAVRGRALALSNQEVRRLETVVRHHMRVLFLVHRMALEGKTPSRRAIYRFFRDTGEVGVDICLLTLADLLATYEQTLPEKTWYAALEVVFLLLQNWFEKPGESVSPQMLVNGDDLMKKFHLQPGKILGELLEAIREAQAIGKIGTPEQAMQFARDRLASSKGER